MKTTLITFKTDPETKEKAQQITEEMGLNVSVVLNALLKNFVRDRSLRIQLADVTKESEAVEHEKPHSQEVAETQQTADALPQIDLGLDPSSIWHTTTVIHGDKTGRTIGFPTANLDMRLMDPATKQGVWAAEVKIGTAVYMGALYYGPRLVKGEHHTVLEIYILDFDQYIYQQQLWFRLVKHIRGTKNFSNLEELKAQLQTDVVDVRQVFSR